MRSFSALAVAFLLASCSGDDASGEPDDDGDDTLDARAPSEPVDAGRPKRDASSYSYDAARRPVPVSKECEPGRYEGEFLCAIIVVPWSGKMAFDLVGNVMGAGEFRSLSVAAGTKISSDLDSMGGTFTGDLQAEFDCDTGQLQGELANGIYLLGNVMPWRFNGPLEGSYRLDDAGVPGFDGTMGTLTTPDLWFYGPLGPSAMCEWNVSRVGDVLDAGTQ